MQSLFSFNLYTAFYSCLCVIKLIIVPTWLIPDLRLLFCYKHVGLTYQALSDDIITRQYNHLMMSYGKYKRETSLSSPRTIFLMALKLLEMIFGETVSSG